MSNFTSLDDDDVTTNRTSSMNCSVAGTNGTCRSNDVITDPMTLTRLICEVWLSLPLATLGIVANIISFIVLSKHKRQLTTTIILKVIVLNVYNAAGFILPLAVTDSLVLVSTILLRSLRYMDIPSYISVYQYIFVTLYPTIYFLRLVDVWLTVLLTVDRYIAVCHPLYAQTLCTKRLTYIFMSMTVALSFCFSLPRFFEYRLVDPGSNEFGFQLTDMAQDQTYTIYYKLTLFFVVAYLVPLCLLVTLNVCLLRTLSNRASQYRTAAFLDHQTSIISSGDMSYARSVTVTVVSVVIVFVACNVTAMTAHLLWSLHICFKHLQYLEIARRYMANISNVFVTFNSAINFVIYCLCSRNFRTILFYWLTCRDDTSGRKCITFRGRSFRSRGMRRHDGSSYSGTTRASTITRLSLSTIYKVQDGRSNMIHRDSTTSANNRASPLTASLDSLTAYKIRNSMESVKIRNSLESIKNRNSLESVNKIRNSFESVKLRNSQESMKITAPEQFPMLHQNL